MADNAAQKESHRARNLKWDRENMRTLSCRVRTEQAEVFKQYCTAHGTTAGELLKNMWANVFTSTAKSCGKPSRRGKSKLLFSCRPLSDFKYQFIFVNNKSVFFIEMIQAFFFLGTVNIFLVNIAFDFTDRK